MQAFLVQWAKVFIATVTSFFSFFLADVMQRLRAFVRGRGSDGKEFSILLVYNGFHIWHAKIADLLVVLVKNFVVTVR